MLPLHTLSARLDGPAFIQPSTIIENTMASQSDSTPTNTSDTSSSSSSASAPGGTGKARSDHHFAEESHNTSNNDQKRFLSHREAEAGGPADMAACGEEDPGAALEMMVEKSRQKNSQYMSS